MNRLETISVGITSLISGWAIVGRPLYNFYKSNQEAERKYDEEFNKLVSSEQVQASSDTNVRREEYE